MLPPRKTTTTRKTELLIWWMDNITPTRRIYVNSHPVSVCLFLLFSSFDLIILWQGNIMAGRLLPAKRRFSALGHRGLLICRRFNNWGLGNCNLGYGYCANYVRPFFLASERSTLLCSPSNPQKCQQIPLEIIGRGIRCVNNQLQQRRAKAFLITTTPGLTVSISIEVEKNNARQRRCRRTVTSWTPKPGRVGVGRVNSEKRRQNWRLFSHQGGKTRDSDCFNTIRFATLQSNTVLCFMSGLPYFLKTSNFWHQDIHQVFP